MEAVEKRTKSQILVDGLGHTYGFSVPLWSKKKSEEALAALPNLDFPTSKTEYWKYTRTGQIAGKSWKFASGAEEVKLPENLPKADLRMVFVNGFYAESLSLLSIPTGMELVPYLESDASSDFQRLDSDAHTRDVFTAMNAAMPQNGFSLKVFKNQAISEQIQIVHLYTGAELISQPRSIIELEKGSEAKLTEYHIHLEKGLTFANIHQEILIGDNAKLGIDVIQQGHEESFTLQQVNAIMRQNSVLTQNNFTLSGKWTRNNTNARITGQNCECNFNGFYIPHLKEHVDNHTIIDHETPHCQSNELYRGVLLDQSTGVFNGKVFVRQDAQKTNAFQSNGNIIVSDTATMNSKPELEIYADDVKCSHGSTTGQLDEDAVFYLRARGLSRENARKMLIAAFAEDVISKTVNSEVREIIEETIRLKLK